MHDCDVLNKRGFARPYVLSEHNLVVKYSDQKDGCTVGNVFCGDAPSYQNRKARGRDHH